ncbi:MAG: hypothetical protein CML20_18285 [Rheinheimera sp.]|nr:hypothetical protein [Rheinheimera sp.]|tara:strand:+ start:2694 stop:4088 length:1395 start_codon:yes stop_codon:yes gene_type:complete
MSVLEQEILEGYKQTEVGVIPEDWELVNFGDIVKYIKGYPFKSSEYTDSGIRVVRVSDTSFTTIKNDNPIYVSESSYNKYKKWSLSDGDLIFTTVGSKPPMYDSLVGKAILVEPHHKGFLLNQNAVLIKPKSNAENISNLLVNHFRTERYIDHIEQIYRGNANQASITLDGLFEFKIPLSKNQKEQTAIANALSDVDALLTELEKLIAKKQAIKTATMQQLLTGKTRLPQFATYTEGEKQGQPKGTKPSELGEIPEDWDVRPIESVIKDLRGGAPFKPSDFTNAGVKVLPKGGVVRGGVLRVHEKDQQFCSKNWSLKYSKNCVDNRYTIVVLRDLVPSGPSIGLMVNIPTDEKYVLAQGVYGFIAEDEETSNYLIQYSNTTQYRKAANEIMVGSTQVHITNGAFKALTVPLPPKEERGAIATILSDMDNEIQTLEQRLAKTRQIKQGMMQELLTGRTRLPIDNE